MTHYHLWIPNIFEFKGGIQVYSAFLLEALQKIAPDAQYDVFLKHDTRAFPRFLPETRFHFAGNVPLKLRTGGFALQLVKAAIAQRPDLIISTHINFTVVADYLKRLLGIPYWVVAHGTEVWDIPKASLRQAIHNADRILAVSEYTRDRLLAHTPLNPEKISILPNTFDESRFKIAPKPPHLLHRHHLHSHGPILLTVARLDPSQLYKGYDKIIEALPRLRAAIPNIHYLLVGKGEDYSRIEKLIQTHHLQDHVTLVGFVSDEELADYYNLCDVFAMPSYGEGFGIVYLEALAAGKPVLGGNQDGAVDALCQGKLGVLVNPHDISEIANTLIEVCQKKYNNSLLYQPEQLRAKVIEVYGFSTFTETLTQILNQ
ncbi:glycosyltransferase [Spirulina sp. CS-785/01]|uniref:glycosyltransferase n=1 Tax=Spirulina sp. CS-785/01 TaxID=3021716 RepID=UPI00233087D1|nr:glycosyltransferase [Spirulina sp. CS-785/01]MDB9311636.1 glycosyltransferase [Spirulina sp. CS-785/01]